MKKQLMTVFALVLGGVGLGQAIALPSYDNGVQAFKERRWVDAMGSFIETIRLEPNNTVAHKYLDTIAQQMAMEREALVREKRVQYLQGVTDELGKSLLASQVKEAIQSATNSEDVERESRWREKLEQARMHKDLGHLLPANDLVFQVLMENPNHQDALRELSDLQSHLREALDTGANLLIEERYACEGFYAYGQADYAAALAAWNKADAVVKQSASPGTVANHLKTLHYQDYEKIAQTKADDEKRQTDLKNLFNRGLASYNVQKFEESLETFRKLAIMEPDYPQLAYYLVQAEAGAEKLRAQRLGEQRQREIAALYERGVSELEKEHFDEAEKAFTKVLAMDPTYTRAASYLLMAKTENQRRHDPKAAQMHYESGLIAYASGKLEEALREWTIAARMNPDHEKAKVALAKVQKEMALYREVPETR